MKSWSPILFFVLPLYLRKVDLSSVEINFKLFNYDKSIISQCLPVYQLSKDSAVFKGILIKDLDAAIDEWHKDNATLKVFKDFFAQERIIGEADFLKFYTKNEDRQECEYCHIKKKELIYDRIVMLSQSFF